VTGTQLYTNGTEMAKAEVVPSADGNSFVYTTKVSSSDNVILTGTNESQDYYHASFGGVKDKTSAANGKAVRIDVKKQEMNVYGTGGASETEQWLIRIPPKRDNEGGISITTTENPEKETELPDTIPELEAELEKQREKFDKEKNKCVKGTDCHCDETKD